MLGQVRFGAVTNGLKILYPVSQFLSTNVVGNRWNMKLSRFTKHQNKHTLISYLRGIPNESKPVLTYLYRT